MLQISQKYFIRHLPKFKKIDPLNKTTSQTILEKNQQNIPSTNLALSESSPNSDLTISPVSNNRNPRNLELLGLKKRDEGWGKLKIESNDSLDGVQDYYWKKFSSYPQRDAYFLMHVFFNKKRTTAVIEHVASQTVVMSASTKEWQIRRRLYNPDDLTAAFNIGRVIADRALNAGLNRVHLVHRDVYNLAKTPKEKEKIQPSQALEYFIKGCLDVGLVLNEDLKEFDTYSLKSEVMDKVFKDEV